MKAQLISRSVNHDTSIKLQNHSYKNFLNIWHYHPELELVVICESTGTRFVGDNIEHFEPGEIVLLGKNLPHLWQNDKIYFEEDSNLQARAQVIHFPESFAGGLFQIPEMTCLNDLLERAKRGIKFMGNSNDLIKSKINKMFDTTGYDRIMIFLDILKLLSSQKEYKILSSMGYVTSFNEIHNSKILPVYEFIMNNFQEEISLETVANIAHMNPSSFSRYFTSIQKKTFTQFLNEIRIGYACKLLIENKYNIAGACYESGFNNVSNFNRQFKAIKKMSPSSFIKLFSTTI